MTILEDLYQSWLTDGSYFNRMIDCGDRYNKWVENALIYLPVEILNEHKENLVFISTSQRDACRVARAYCENREVIVLSDRVLPKRGADEGQSEVRYFIYTVLHEVAHAIKKHKSPKFDALTPQEVESQEKEADELSLSWFNQHVAEVGNPHIIPITVEEIQGVQERHQVLMEKLYEGV
jgi:hypothetical protein